MFFFHVSSDFTYPGNQTAAGIAVVRRSNSLVGGMEPAIRITKVPGSSARGGISVRLRVCDKKIK